MYEYQSVKVIQLSQWKMCFFFRSNLNEEDRGSPNEENRSGTRPSVINNVTINMREVDIRANDLSFVCSDLSNNLYCTNICD